MTTHVTIASRFCGPPSSGNGGYACGLAAAGMAGPVQATLRRPPPLEHRLRVERNGTCVLHDGEDAVVEARPADLALDVPPAPSLARAEEMSRRFVGFAAHPFPTCFVCGPARAPGDGLRIFAGGEPDDGLVAGPWITDRSLAGPGDRVRPEFLWAALDCPGYFAVAAPGERAVLGRMTAEVDPGLAPGERCVVVGWGLGRSGRKLQAGTALFDASGRLRGRSLQTWITI
jgi:hypothetical protein